MVGKAKYTGCSVEGCSGSHEARGYCNMHYKRVRKGSLRPEDPPAARYKTPQEAFEARTEWSGDCLVWTGATNPMGYGVAWDGRRTQLAHRLAWVSVHGDLEVNEYIDHICHNRACVSLAHLRVADRFQNGANRRGAKAGTATGVRNVSRNGSGYMVQVVKNREYYYFGTHRTLAEAATVAESARKELFGEFRGRA